MNGKVYDQIIEQYKNAKTAKERQDCVWTMICMIGINHLPHIEKRQRKTLKVTIGIGVAILLAILFSDQVSLTSIVAFIAKVL